MKNTIIAIIATLLLLCGCGNKNTPVESTVATSDSETNEVLLSAQQIKASGLIIGQMEKHNIKSTLKLNGKIDVPPQNLVSISAPLGGFLRSTTLLPGLHVSKGEVIATMEDEHYIQIQEDYLLNKSKLHFALLEYNRQKELNQSQASSNKITEKAEADMTSLNIMVKSLEEKLKLIHINPQGLSATNLSKSIPLYSSITGYVSKVNVNIGKYVNPSDVLFELIDPTDIHLNLKVFEKDLTHLFIGQRLMVYTNTAPEKRYSCEIILISKDISEDGLTDVHCHFLNYDKALIPGMYMNAEVALNTSMADCLPESAIVDFEGKSYVFIAIGSNHFKMQEVKTGETSDGYTAILKFQEIVSKTIVKKGAYALLMKLKNKED